jgi:hypothetical protein
MAHESLQAAGAGFAANRAAAGDVTFCEADGKVLRGSQKN